MTYPSAVDCRARRRRNLTFLLLIGIAIAVVVLAVRYRTERRETVDYLSLAQEITDQQLDMSTSLTDLMISIGDLERPDILLRLETLAADGDAAIADLEQAVVPRPAAKASGLFLVAIENWANGVGAMGPAFVAILDGADDDPTGDQLLVDAFQMLRVADAAYVQFLEAVAEIDDAVTRGEFPDIVFAGGENEPLFDAEMISSRLRLTRKLEESHDVAVIVTTEPELITDLNGVNVLPVAEDYTIVAVVTNEGNVGEEFIEVSLALAGSDQSLEPIELVELVPFLEPGQAIAVEFRQSGSSPGRVL